jgi:hypothetical protein
MKKLVILFVILFVASMNSISFADNPTPVKPKTDTIQGPTATPAPTSTAIPQTPAKKPAVKKLKKTEKPAVKKPKTWREKLGVGKKPVPKKTPKKVTPTPAPAPTPVPAPAPK